MAKVKKVMRRPYNGFTRFEGFIRANFAAERRHRVLARVIAEYINDKDSPIELHARLGGAEREAAGAGEEE